MIESFDKNELILEGLAYTVMGILIVFMILVIIMLVIKAMALFSAEIKPEPVKTSPVEVVQSASAEEDKKADDYELVAVITAAIAATMGHSTNDFVVRSYRKVSGGAWNKAGRREVLENRF